MTKLQTALLEQGLLEKVKEYDCGGCGRHLYRDYNAALNILDIGIRDISAEHFQKKQANFGSVK